MGIRVHKAIGYGVRPFQVPEGFRDLHNEAFEVTLGDFALWCVRNKDRILSFVPETERGRRMMFTSVDLTPLNEHHFEESLGSRIVYEDEGGFEDALLIQPIAHDDWKRMDSSIDWVEESQFHQQRPRFEFVECGLYPHDRGKPPLSVAAILLWLGLEELWPQLREALYVYWS